MAAALLLAGLSLTGCASADGDDSSRPTGSLTPSASPSSLAGASDGLPYLDNECGQKGRIRPHQFLFNCADAGTLLTGLHWRSWTPRHAVADVRRMSVKTPMGEPRIYQDAHLEAFEPVRMADGSRYFGCVLIRPGLNPANARGDTWVVVPLGDDALAQPADGKFALNRCRLRGIPLMSE